MTRWITARAPATIANLICGFDTLSLAVDGPYDKVSIRPNDSNQWRILEVVNGEGLPTDPERNVATFAMQRMSDDVGSPTGYDVRIVKGYEAGSGMGSSAASAAAALCAYNASLGYPLHQRALIKYAMQSEALVSGHPIADNVSAALLGGLVLIRSAEELDFISLPVPDLWLACVRPNRQIMTREARDILPLQIPLSMAIQHSAHLAGFVSAAYTQDYDLMKRSMRDLLIEPHRGKLIPHYDALKDLMNDSDLLSFGIAGSGPTVIAFCTDESQADRAARSIQTFWSQNSIDSIAYVHPIAHRGAFVIDHNYPE